LIHEAAHEDANIIVGAVIDETLGDEELRVTVIATGLDSEEVRRTPPESRRRLPVATSGEIERERAMVDAPNVTPIRQDPAAAPAMASDTHQSAPPVERQQAAAGDAEEMAALGFGFESPFEDELDTPAFLRKRNVGTDHDRDVPTFMKRGGSD
jgi:cell division protein FtsZ